MNGAGLPLHAPSGGRIGNYIGPELKQEVDDRDFIVNLCCQSKIKVYEWRDMTPPKCVSTVIHIYVYVCVEREQDAPTISTCINRRGAARWQQRPDHPAQKRNVPDVLQGGLQRRKQTNSFYK